MARRALECQVCTRHNVKLYKLSYWCLRSILDFEQHYRKKQHIKESRWFCHDCGENFLVSLRLAINPLEAKWLMEALLRQVTVEDIQEGHA